MNLSTKTTIIRCHIPHCYNPNNRSASGRSCLVRFFILVFKGKIFTNDFTLRIINSPQHFCVRTTRGTEMDNFYNYLTLDRVVCNFVFFVVELINKGRRYCLMPSEALRMTSIPSSQSKYGLSALIYSDCHIPEITKDFTSSGCPVHPPLLSSLLLTSFC